MVKAAYESHWPVRMVHAANRVYARVFQQVRVHGRNAIPKIGPAMLIANHRSGVDPLLIMALSPRPIRWMMAKEYESIRPLRRLFEVIRTIGVARDGRDSRALREALRALHHGDLLGVFPEGRIETSANLLPFQPGAAMIALRARVPVIPVYHHGMPLCESMTVPFAVPQTVDITIGPPIDLAAHLSLREVEPATQFLQRSVLALAPSTQMGVPNG